MVQVNPLAARFCEYTSSTLSPSRSPSVRRERRVDVAGDQRGIVEQISASTLFQPQRIEADPPANDPEHLARQQPRQLRARGRGIR